MASSCTDIRMFLMTSKWAGLNNWVPCGLDQIFFQEADLSVMPSDSVDSHGKAHPRGAGTNTATKIDKNMRLIRSYGPFRLVP